MREQKSGLEDSKGCVNQLDAKVGSEGSHKLGWADIPVLSFLPSLHPGTCRPCRCHWATGEAHAAFPI